MLMVWQVLLDAKTLDASPALKKPPAAEGRSHVSIADTPWLLAKATYEV